MKLTLATALATIALASPAHAAFNSAYTDIDLDECLVLDADDFGASWSCPGYKGYPLMVTEGDLRFSLIYGFGARAADGQTLPPFNRLGDKLEWRLSNELGRWMPIATIIRYHTADPETGVDLYLGSGGAPEGVLAAAALRCVGGQFNGRLLFRNEAEKARAYKWGIEDLERIYLLEDLARGDCIFAATGVTSGSLLEGVKRKKNGRMTTESVVMRASTGTVRWVRTEHRVG